MKNWNLSYVCLYSEQPSFRMMCSCIHRESDSEIHEDILKAIYVKDALKDFFIPSFWVLLYPLILISLHSISVSFSGNFMEQRHGDGSCHDA